MQKNIAYLLVGLLVLAGCTNQSTTNESATTIQIDGSSTVYPLTEAVAEEFRAEAPDVNVTVGLAGTGGGFKKFCRGEIDINDASREIKESEITECDAAGIEYVSSTVAYDGMAILVHPSNTWATNITVEELKKIWEPEAQGVIMKWNQIRSDWPDKEIALYGAGTASGTFDYFTEAIVGEAGKSRGDYTASEDDNVLVQGISNDQYALGFFGLSYYEENADKLKLVPVDNGNGPVLPSVETVKNGTYAPLSRPLYVYTTSTALEREEVKQFMRFYLENAGELAVSAGYIPLSDEEYTTELSEFEAAL